MDQIIIQKLVEGVVSEVELVDSPTAQKKQQRLERKVEDFQG